MKKLLDFSDRSNQKKYCETAPIYQKTVSTNTIQLYIRISINGKTKNIIIDFGTTENFITKNI